LFLVHKIWVETVLIRIISGCSGRGTQFKPIRMQATVFAGQGLCVCICSLIYSDLLHNNNLLRISSGFFDLSDGNMLLRISIKVSLISQTAIVSYLIKGFAFGSLNPNLLSRKWTRECPNSRKQLQLELLSEIPW
jgi:hypothetical protein